MRSLAFGPLGLIIVTSVVAIYSLNLIPFDAGTGDFLYYWASVRALIEGRNPYDQFGVLSIAQQINPALTSVLPVHYPPLIFSLLIPLGYLPFEMAAQVWLNVSAIIIGGSTMAAAYVSATSRRSFTIVSMLLIILLLSSVPVLFHLKLGHFSALLLLCVTLLYIRAKLGLELSFWDGCLMGLTCWKPHLCLLLTLVVLCHGSRKGSLVIAGFLCGILLLIPAPLLFRPQIFSDFFSALHHSPFQWKTPTLGWWLGELVGSQNWFFRLAPLLIASGVVLIWCIRNNTTKLSPQVVLLLVPLGLISAPHAYTYDFVLLQPVVVVALLRTIEANRSSGNAKLALVLLLAGSHIGLWLQLGLMHYHIWYPLMFLALAIMLSKAPHGEKSKEQLHVVT